MVAEVRYSPFEFLPQDNEGKVAHESEAEEAVKALDERAASHCLLHGRYCSVGFGMI